MKRIRVLILAGLAFFGAMAGVAHAQTIPSLATHEQAVTLFQSIVSVNTDNSVSVREVIDYDTGPSAHHGIYRDIRPVSSENRSMSITDISVTDMQGNPVTWVRQSANGNVRIRIGDANVTFIGQRTYVIKYKATSAVAQLKDIDEIYWNVTGNDWEIPIYKAQVKFELPLGAVAQQSSCYSGPQGSKGVCEVDFSKQGDLAFGVSHELRSGEGLTAAVGFQKGIVVPYSALDDFFDNIGKYITWLIIILLPLITFIVMFRKWYKKGRDPKGTGVIVPQYDVPDGLTPMEVAGIVNQGVTSADISSEIIYLATKGYLKIKYVDNKILGFIKNTDYELELLRRYDDLPNEFDKTLLNHVFALNAGPGEKIKLSDLKNSFYTRVPIITKSALQTLLDKQYYSNLKIESSGAAKAISSSFFILLWGGIIVYHLIDSVFSAVAVSISPVPIIASVILSIIIGAVFHSLMPAKTIKGVAAKEYILGLKDYLQIAEKDRLNFHNAPEKRPEIFEKLLPYAMVLGVASAWSKEFADIYVNPPSWYEGYPVGGHFNSMLLYSNLSGFNSMASTSMTSMPGGGMGGSGGGGFSGGGGGGGGGGGW
jgi:uncharacterized membrane protein YgcG